MAYKSLSDHLVEPAVLYQSQYSPGCILRRAALELGCLVSDNWLVCEFPLVTFLGVLKDHAMELSIC
jgi:hypothetical protein